MSARTTSLIAFLAALCTLCGCQPRAPLFIGGSADIPQVPPAALQRMMKSLDLPDQQRVQTADLHAAYCEAHTQAARKYREYLALAEGIIEKDSSSPGTSRVKARRDEATTKFAAHTSRIANEFLEDLRLTLSPQQLPRWDAALRSLRRTRSTGSAYAEKSADLSLLLESLPEFKQTPPSAEAVKAVRAWEEAVDPVLVRKESFITTTLAENLRSEREGDNNAKSALHLRWRAIIREERTITIRACRELAALLPEGTAQELLAAVHRQTYPWLFADSEAASVLDRAAKLDALSPDNKKLIAELKRDLAAEQARAAATIAAAFESWELTATDEQIGSSDHPDLDPELLNRYSQAESHIIRRLNEILTPQQAKEVEVGKVTRELPPIEFD